jgi:histidinol-phosphatase
VSALSDPRRKHEILNFALSLANAAESVIMPLFRACSVSWKADGSEVTDADRRAEEVMREMIAKRFPNHAVLGEEYGGPCEPSDTPLWILDPVDGTASFAVGLPTFGILIGYLESGKPQAGVIHFPAMGETVYAVRGFGCWAAVGGSEARQVHVSAIKSLKDAYASSSDVNLPGTFPLSGGPAYNVSALIQRARRFRFISDCVQHALVAQGRIDLAIDTIMKPWDIAALVPCIEEAGGVATDLKGQHEDIVWKKSLVTSCNAQLHEEAIGVLSLN